MFFLTNDNFKAKLQAEETLHVHWQVMGYGEGFGVVEMRTLEPNPHVAFVDNEKDFIRLALEMDGKICGVFGGVQLRLIHFHDFAPNRWVRAQGKPFCNCASDSDIDRLTSGYLDIDVVSESRNSGYAASEEELEQSLYAAQLLCCEDGLRLNSAIVCTGNGHAVYIRIVPIDIDGPEIASKYKCFCKQLVDQVVRSMPGVRADSVSNLSRVSRLPGTMNLKGKTAEGRPHRRAHFVSMPAEPGRSIEVYYRILNTEVEGDQSIEAKFPDGIRCDLQKLQACDFIQWCKKYPELVSEPLWWAMITNLSLLVGGRELIHGISKLDPVRYDYRKTENVITRVVDSGYKPMLCKNFSTLQPTGLSKGKFHCPRMRNCLARAPIYLATSHIVYTR